MSITLRTLPAVWRTFLSAFLIMAAIGYTLGVFFVDHTTDTTPSGIAERYLGSERLGIDIDELPADREIHYEKSSAEMLNVTHTHVISLAMLFLAVGGVFLLADRLPSWLRAALAIEPFLSLAITFGGIWLLRWHDPAWGVVIAISGTLMSLCFYAMILISLWQLLISRHR